MRIAYCIGRKTTGSYEDHMIGFVYRIRSYQLLDEIPSNLFSRLVALALDYRCFSDSTRKRDIVSAIARARGDFSFESLRPKNMSAIMLEIRRIPLKLLYQRFDI